MIYKTLKIYNIEAKDRVGNYILVDEKSGLTGKASLRLYSSRMRDNSMQITDELISSN